MKYITLRAKLRKRLAGNETLIAPGVYDALSARQVELAGYPAVHAGSYSFASSLGLPDVGILNMTEMCDKVREVADAVSIPVIADAENGFHGPSALARVVRAFEHAGACGIHIEDHLSGKHTSESKRVIPLEQAVQKIRAAVAGRDDPNFLVIARTDVAWATNRVADAVERMVAFAEAGADAVMPIGLTLEQLHEIRQRIAVPVVIVNTHGNSLESERAAGANLVIYHSFCIDAATFGIQHALQRFAATKNIRSLEGSISSHEEMEALLKYAEYDERRRSHAAFGSAIDTDGIAA